VDTSQLVALLAVAVVLIAAGLRFSRAWITVAGIAVAGFVAFGHLTARFGVDQVWFRAPTFFVALVILLFGALWWMRRPLPLKRRVGALVAVLGLTGAVLAITLLDGRGTPPSMLLPTRNQPAPDFAFVDDAGRTRRLSELKGDVVLINFWATWCAPCRREMPLLAKMQRDYAQRNFRVVYLSLEEPDVLAAFRAKNHFDGIQGRLDAAPPFYDAGRFYPLTYLVGRDGAVVARWSGRPGESWLDGLIERQL